MHLVRKFQRITSVGNYIPEIDGLRFLAIFLVIIFHANGYFISKLSDSYTRDFYFENINKLLHTWDKGVELFFVISGFILALPFAGHELANGKKVSLKVFYLRRLTRLEPPYMLTIIVLFLVLLITKTYDFPTLFSSLLASLTYTHNVIFGMPLIAVVTWLLEIEIQFYLIVPLISKVYGMEKLKRRLLLTVLIIAFSILQYLLPARVITLYSFIQYFLMGFLLADMYVVKDIQWFNKSSVKAVAVGIFLFLLILITDNHSKPYGELLFITAVFLFYYLVLFNSFWKKVFSITVVSIIGGMCYSIYLWHFAIISAFGKYFVSFKATGIFLPDFLLFLMMMLIPILLFSGLFYLYIEKPCMAKNWHKNLFTKLGLINPGVYKA